MEKVAAFNGITFYDDSKGTNVGATVAALNGMTQSVVLIAGGDGKGQDFSPLAKAIAEHARAVVLIGRDAGKIATAIQHGGVPLHHATTMEEAVREKLYACPGGRRGIDVTRLRKFRYVQKLYSPGGGICCGGKAGRKSQVETEISATIS